MREERLIYCFTDRQVRAVRWCERLGIVKVTGFMDVKHPLTNEFALKIIRSEVVRIFEPRIQGFIDRLNDKDGQRRKDELIRIGYIEMKPGKQEF